MGVEICAIGADIVLGAVIVLDDICVEIYGAVPICTRCIYGASTSIIVRVHDDDVPIPCMHVLDKIDDVLHGYEDVDKHVRVAVHVIVLAELGVICVRCLRLAVINPYLCERAAARELDE